MPSLPTRRTSGRDHPGLVLELVATRRGHAALGDQGTSPWLFPGGQPGRPVSSFQLAERLRQLGLHPGQARSTALFQLTTEQPAALLARMLGIHITVAVAWQRASSGDWASYASDVSRRTNPGGHAMHRDEKPVHTPSAISPERATEIEDMVDRVTRWAVDRHDTVGLLLAGSCARNAARPDSDIDFVLLTSDETHYVDNAWACELELGEPTRTQSWGTITERRFVTASGPPGSKWKSISARPPGQTSTRSTPARTASSPTEHVPSTTPQEPWPACSTLADLDHQPLGQKP
jgi:predicted nucleotidyltransferase